MSEPSLIAAKAAFRDTDVVGDAHATARRIEDEAQHMGSLLNGAFEAGWNAHIDALFDAGRDPDQLAAENARLREALNAFVAAWRMPRYAETVNYPERTTTFHKEWGGGECSRHGTWYGTCYGCMDADKQARDDADRIVQDAREDAISDAFYAAHDALSPAPAKKENERE